MSSLPSTSGPDFKSRLGSALKRSRICGVLLLLLGICLLRALPAFHRGTYATEGGAWLAQMWQVGFPQALLTIRPDYCVLGNLCVIKASDLITVWSSGSPLGAMGPFWQHTMAALYVALNFLLIFTVLRRHHGWQRALLVTVVMLLAPDLDDENRIFGEANNVGFFSVIAVVFIYYDFWLSRDPGWRRSVVWLTLIVFHILTSPLAGVVAAGFSTLMLARLGWQACRDRAVSRTWWAFVAGCTFPILLAGFTIWRAKHHGASATMAAESASGGIAALKPFLIDYVLCRQWLYPITLNFYLTANDTITLGVFAAVLAGLGFWLWSEKRRSSLAANWRRITGLLLISLISMAVAILTLYSRRWLTGKGFHYESLWPARYYLVQTMMMAGFFCLVLLRCGDLWPRFRLTAWGLPVLMGLNFAALQYPHVKTVLANPDPAVAARRWSAQLSRVSEIHTLTGDLPGAAARHIPARLEVPMYIDGHALPVPAALAQAAWASHAHPAPDKCEIMATDPGVLLRAAPSAPHQLEVRDLRLIPRSHGLLLTADLYLPAFNIIAKRRQLQMGQLPGHPAVKAWWYSADALPDLTKPRRNRRDQKNWLFKIAVWWDQPGSLEEIRTALIDLPIALGKTPEEPSASAVLLQKHDPLCLSALRDDPVCALIVSPQLPGFEWHWGSGPLKTRNLSITREAVNIPLLTESDFNETAYLQLNPEVQRAMDLKAITSGWGHYQAFGKNEARPFAIRSVEVDLSHAGLTSNQISGLAIETDRVRRATPGRLRAVFHGPNAKQFSFDIRPPEGKRDFSVNFLPAAWSGEPFPLQSLEIQFDSILSDSAFRLTHLNLTKYP